MTYVEISKKWFEHTLNNLGKSGYTWEEIVDEKAKENVYMVHINNMHMKVFSSIVDGVSRDVGEDAIRVVGWDVVSNRPISVAEGRVNRTENWADNLKIRINTVLSKLVEIQDSPKCKICGGIVVEMEGKYGKFDGCLNYKNHTKFSTYSKSSGRFTEKNKEFWE